MYAYQISGISVVRSDREMALACSPALTAALQEVSVRIPSLKRDIQDGLLKMLSCILMQRPLKHPGIPKHMQVAQQTPGDSLAGGTGSRERSVHALGGKSRVMIVILCGLMM